MNDEVESRALNGELLQAETAFQHTDDFERHMRVIEMCVGRVTGLLKPMNGQVINIKTEPRKIPSEVPEFNIAAGDLFELRNQFATNSFTEGIAAEICEQAHNCQSSDDSGE